MTSCIKGVVALSLTCIAVDAFATFVSESDVRKAAEAFVSTDTIGSSVLSGRSVAGASKRDGLWIVALAPSGHVIFSGSDLADPIVGFSENDFVEPDPESPAFAVLEGADASIAAAEAQGAGTRHARWAKLLGGMAKKGLLKAADVESPGTIVIPQFLESHYNQWQPYNDYAPVFEPDENYFESGREPYRGRCPCGCVATAAAQGFRHFRWPARMDRVDFFNHNFTDASNVTKSFPLRFDGNVPIDWDALDDDYASDAGGEWIPDPERPGTGWLIWKPFTDLRGTVPEATRNPISRLIMLADVLAHMSFGADDSSANYGTVAANASDWYTQGTWVSPTDARVKSDIENGVPVQVSIPRHAVVGHGWANDGTDTYIYLNYGWGGSNDGYYNINGTTIQNVYVGHYPRAKPQIDPLPAVSGTSLSLNWHFPDFYTNRLSGFTVSLKKTATETSTYVENFSVSSGVATGDEGIFKVGTHSKGYDGNLLYCVSAYKDGQYAIVNSAYYTFPEVYTLTSASVLTLKLRSYLALSNDFEIQARFNGGEWTTIMSPSLSEYGDSGWGTEKLYLGNHGGETIQLRFYKAYRSGSCYTDNDCILVDDVVLTYVLAQDSALVQNVPSSARSCAFAGLDAGSTCAFTVMPVMSGALVAAEASEPITTSIEGERRTPVPGEQTYSSQNLVFPTNDTSGVWSYSHDSYGSVVDDSSVKGIFNCSITARLSGAITTASTLSFQWSASDYPENSVNSWSAVFIDALGNETSLGGASSTSNISMQNVNLSLAGFAGQSGSIRISYSHDSGGAWTISSGILHAPSISNVLVPSVPAVAWDTETLTALGTPEILSVSAVSEGFYGECWTNTTTFLVVCSNTVVKLEARPSHLSLVNDDDVSVSLVENGKFKVCVTPSGINESNFRSRMILTLVGTDSNGTKCYKDLSLRFSQVEPKPTEVHVEATTSSGVAFSVDIPYSWLEDNGLVASGSDAALASTADADSDGLPNWAEYVCGTDPSDPDDKLTASITMVDGEPVVTYTPDDERIVSGFKAVIKGTTDLSAALSTWEVVTDTRMSTCRFFRVEIVPEN